jgi:xylan 1,4-beta-xylosidase
MYSSYTAASFARKHDLADKHGINLEGALTWAFEFEDQSYFAGFRALASNGIDLPVLNVFRMYSLMAGQRVAAHSSAEVPLDTMVKAGVRDAPDVAAIASLEGTRLAVMVWHYHDDDIEGPAAEIQLNIRHLPLARGNASLAHFRIDESHSNAFAEWKRQGSPIAPNGEHYQQLKNAGKLAKLGPDQPLEIKDAVSTLRFSLPRQGVSLLVLDLPSAAQSIAR